MLNRSKLKTLQDQKSDRKAVEIARHAYELWRLHGDQSAEFTSPEKRQLTDQMNDALAVVSTQDLQKASDLTGLDCYRNMASQKLINAQRLQKEADARAKQIEQQMQARRDKDRGDLER